MFGYVIASVDALTPEQAGRYRACYCGLCRALGRRHGPLSRLTLNFDMTFLVLLLTSMYEPPETARRGRCFVHPVHERASWSSRFTDYAADMTVALAYYNCLDDWRDGKKVFSLAEAKLLRGGFERAAERWPRQCAAISECIEALTEIEQGAGEDPDAAANCFGRLMGELFVYYEDSWEGQFRLFGQALGRFVYMMDACVDLDGDIRHGRYNPFAALGGGNLTREEKRSILTMLIGECAAEFEKLPLLQDVEIMRSILYSGVWIQYERALKKKGEGEDDRRSL